MDEVPVKMNMNLDTNLSFGLEEGGLPLYLSP